MKKVSEIYDNLYHYTNWDGLLGILKSQNLWATHCRFLNDFSEIEKYIRGQTYAIDRMKTLGTIGCIYGSVVLVGGEISGPSFTN